MVGETIAGEAVNIMHAPAPLLVLALFLTLGVGLQPSSPLLTQTHTANFFCVQGEGSVFPAGACLPN